ncbi:MAG: hypothetical protein IMX05_09835 [Hydrogenibacillus schlegelii]|nr:hypothetical protein [Hydrogenibacillus schlegelii]
MNTARKIKWSVAFAASLTFGAGYAAVQHEDAVHARTDSAVSVSADDGPAVDRSLDHPTESRLFPDAADDESAQLPTLKSKPPSTDRTPASSAPFSRKVRTRVS